MGWQAGFRVVRERSYRDYRWPPPLGLNSLKWWDWNPEIPSARMGLLLVPCDRWTRRRAGEEASEGTSPASWEHDCHPHPTLLVPGQCQHRGASLL